MDNTAVEEDLRCVGDAVKGLQCLIKLILVVALERCHPGFNFLFPSEQLTHKSTIVQTGGAHLLQRHVEGSCA